MSESLPILPSCSGCGVCCLHMGYPAYIQPSDDHPGEEYWHALPDSLREELQDYIDHYQAEAGQLDGPCIWLDWETRQCKHHEFRPRVCRDFEIGSVGCHEWRHHYRSKIKMTSES